jgi:hypothetical protein
MRLEQKKPNICAIIWGMWVTCDTVEKHRHEENLLFGITPKMPVMTDAHTSGNIKNEEDADTSSSLKKKAR